tara:strand:+ start:4319 stop:5008 length:690 start_codon:yes stop_codon:yes gene_type:complete
VSKHNNDIEVTEEQVALYLKNHPGFFLKRDDLLCEIELTHSSGEAVSLLERQVSLLRERNMDIRSRLNSLLDNARNNDRLFEKTKAIVLALLEAKSLDSIVNTLTRGLKNEFAMDYASLILFADPQTHRNSASRIVPLDDAFHAIPGLLKSNKATCGVLRPEELAFLFPNQHRDVGSAAVVPLSFGHPLGVIAIGSKDSHYFRSSMGTLFLGYIAEVLNRILPRYLSLN